MTFDEQAIEAAAKQTYMATGYAPEYKKWDGLSEELKTSWRLATCEILSAAFQSMKERGKLPLSALEGERYEHRKGGRYIKIGVGKIQTTQPLADMAEVVIYRSEKDGSLWARDKAEFEDGRFRLVPVEG